MLRKLLSTIALLACRVFTAHAAPTITLTPSLTNLTVGDFLTLDINIQGAVDLYSWQFDVNFAPAGNLVATGQADGGFLSPGQTFGAGVVDNGAGTITAVYSTLSGFIPGVDGFGILAQITFEAMLEGLATISVANIMLLDSNGDDIFFNIDQVGNALSATVNVTGPGDPVPEPSGLALAGLALALAIRSSRQRGRALTVA